MKYNYGKQISRTVQSDRFIKTKNRIFAKYQYSVLKRFARLRHPSFTASLFSTTARKIVGAYLYSIKIEMNDYCNLNCKMCYVPDQKRELPKERIFDLFDQVKSKGVRIELLGGEPMMRPDISEIITYAKRKTGVPFVSLYTNGTQITETSAQSLKKAGLDAVLVTLISHKKEVHDNFTGVKGSWDKTISGIRNLLKAGIATYTFSSIHRENYNDYKDIYQFVKQTLKAHALFYQYIPQKKDDPLMIDPVEWHKIKHSILTEISPEHMGFVRDFYLLTGNACSGGNFVLTVKVDGSVQPCPFISDIPLGNIFNDTIWDIYKKRFRNTELKAFKSVPPECKECAYETICGGGCKAGNMLLEGTYECKDHRCLGPYSDAKEKELLMSDIPTFF